ncbi:Valine--tRNA ligase [Bienertia sinuspersici]
MMKNKQTGNDDKSVGKTNSFKLFGRGPSTPGRSLSKKKSNPLFGMFSRKKSDKQNVADNDSDSPRSSDADADSRKPPDQEIAVPSIVGQIEKAATQPYIQTAAQDLLSANTVVEPKETKEPATTDDEKKDTDGSLISQLKELAEEEILEKGKESLKEVFIGVTRSTHDEELAKTSDEIVEKGKKGLKDIFHKALATHKDKDKNNNEEDEQPQPVLVEDYEKTGTTQEMMSNVNVDEQPSNLSAPKQLQQQVVPVPVPVPTVVDDHRKEETSRGENQETVIKPEEDNCVASLAEGLQKMCATWNNNNNKDA